MKKAPPEQLHACWKLIHSRPIDEDDVTIHLAIYPNRPICGINKTKNESYDLGDEPVLYHPSTFNTCCQRCLKVARKRYNW